MSKKSDTEIYLVAKKKHFEYLRKHNALIDAKYGELTVGAMSTFNVVLKEYQITNELSHFFKWSYLRKKLKLTKNNDYKNRIKKYLLELKLPKELRDFTNHYSGMKIKYTIEAFLEEVVEYEDQKDGISVTISEKFLSYLIEKGGYTELPDEEDNMIKGKYGKQLYEFYLRYYGLPNKKDSRMGTMSLSLDELNGKFGTSHKYPSKIESGIKRGIKEIKLVQGIELFYFWDDINKKFVFSWARDNLVINSSMCRIPSSRIEELIDWVVLHTKNIDDLSKYKIKIRNLIVTNQFNGVDDYYRGMLQHKYNLTSDDIDKMIYGENKIYQDFDYPVKD